MCSYSFFKIACSAFLLSVVLSCTTGIPDNEISSVSKSYNEVDRALWPYFEAFEEAAERYNLNIDLEQLDITGVIEEIPEEGVAGTCQHGLHIHHVTIDINFWNQFSSNRKEMVVFHELGHCVLGRGHTEEEDDNGSCLSIMNSGTSGCNVLYNKTNKTYYLQELFSGA